MRQPHGRSSIATDVLDDVEDDIVKQTYDIYGQMSDSALSRLTHEDGSPWSLTYNGAFGTVISNDLVEDYYARRAKAQEPA